MPRLLAASSLLLAVGATLVLSEVRWFSRQPLVDRLRPYTPGQAGRAEGGAGVLSVASLLGEAILRIHEETSVSSLFDSTRE